MLKNSKASNANKCRRFHPIFSERRRIRGEGNERMYGRIVWLNFSLYKGHVDEAVLSDKKIERILFP
jgi:hypothetical protein